MSHPRMFAVRGDLPYVGIGYEVVARYRERIEHNHVATLEELHASGGLDWYEFYCGFHDLPLFPAVEIPKAEARRAVLRIVQMAAGSGAGKIEHVIALPGAAEGRD